MRKAKPSVFLAVAALVCCVFAFLPNDGSASTVPVVDVMGPFLESSPDASGALDLDDPLDPEATLALGELQLVQCDRHKPIERFEEPTAIEPDAPVPLSGFAKS